MSDKRVRKYLQVGTMECMLLCMGVAIAAAVVVYLVFAIAMKMITKEDMHLIPGGEKIAKILHMR